MSFEFSEEELKKVEEIKQRYPEQKAAIMPVLWMAQEKNGWISPQVEEYVAKLLDLPLAHVKGISTFYTMYFKKPMGKYHIQVCTNVSCMINGGVEIFEALKEKLGVGNNEATPDGKFSIEEVECLGACGGAPAIAVNDEYYENMSVEKALELINSLK